MDREGLPKEEASMDMLGSREAPDRTWIEFRDADGAQQGSVRALARGSVRGGMGVGWDSEARGRTPPGRRRSAPT
jgi:hypothetical protein